MKNQHGRKAFVARPSQVVALKLLFFVVALFFIAACDDGESVVSTDTSADSGNYYAKNQEWQAVDTTSPNVSHFIYLDLNRNGSYDYGEPPLSGIAVRLIKPDQSFALQRSNIRGFVNFTNSLTASPVDVSEPGEYTFEVMVPEGWVLTSDNRVQQGTYSEEPASRPGIVIDRVPEPAGLAQVLTIEGRLLTRSESGELVSVKPSDVAVSFSSPTGARVPVDVDSMGHFSATVEPGRWSLEARHLSSGAAAARVVDVNRASVRLSGMILGDIFGEPGSNLNTIDFEDITESVITKAPNGIGLEGLKWVNMIVTDNELYEGAGYINNTISGRYVAYNSSGYPVTIWREEAFDFHGAYFGVAWPVAEGETLEVKAWRDDMLIGQEELELSAFGPFWFDAAYYGITKLELSTRHYWQFVTDDMAFGD